MATRDHFLDDGIIQAAYSEFLAYGFQKASLHKIAEKASVTMGAIYTRYKSKVQRMNGFFSSFFNFFIPVHLFHDLHAKVAAVIAASQLSRSPSFYTRSCSTGRRRRECTAAQSQSRRRFSASSPSSRDVSCLVLSSVFLCAKKETSTLARLLPSRKYNSICLRMSQQMPHHTVQAYLYHEDLLIPLRIQS